MFCNMIEMESNGIQKVAFESWLYLVGDMKKNTMSITGSNQTWNCKYNKCKTWCWQYCLLNNFAK